MQEVVLYGVGLDGEKFYCKYKNKFKFVFAVDQNSGRTFHGMLVYHFDEVKEEIKKYFIYVAVGLDTSWQAIRDLLKSNGLKEFRNFASKEFAEKKLAILYGNCHMNILGEYLQANPDFHRVYALRCYSLMRIESAEDDELKACALFITQDIRENNELGMPPADGLIRMLESNHCRCIKVPNLYGCNLLFPQLKRCEQEELDRRHQRHINEEAIELKGMADWGVAKIRDLSMNTLMWKDICLEQLYSNGGDISQIETLMNYGEPFSQEQIQENFLTEMQKLKEREKVCDIRISDYIEENYRTKLLFYEPYHPVNEVIFEKGRRILALLKMTVFEECPIKDSLDGSEVFIYGCVRRALHLEFEQKYIRKSNLRGSYRFTLRDIPLTMKEYIEEYIAWNLGG